MQANKKFCISPFQNQKVKQAHKALLRSLMKWSDFQEGLSTWHITWCNIKGWKSHNCIRPTERSLQPVSTMGKPSLYSRTVYKSSICQNSVVLDPEFRFSFISEYMHKCNNSREKIQPDGKILIIIYPSRRAKNFSSLWAIRKLA